MKRRFIIDTDTAGDDTTAIFTALHYFHVEGLTIVSGNIDYNQQVENALYTLETASPDYYVPVYKGHRDPIMTLEGSKHTTEERIFAIETVKNNPGEIELLAIGPLTNIAMAIKRDPSIIPDIKHLWIMGGVNHSPGNIRAVAEFNFNTDPEAAKIVLHSGIEMTMVTWDACLDYGVLYEEDLKQVEALNTKGSKFFLDVNLHVKEFEKKKRNVDGVTCPDSLAAVIAAKEELLLESSKYYVDIECASPLTRGYNIVDVEGDLKKEPNVRICETIDSEGFKKVILDVLANIK